MEGIVTDQNYKKGAFVVFSEYIDKGTGRYKNGESRIGKLENKSSDTVCDVLWDNGRKDSYYMKELQFINTIDDTYDSISDSIRNILIGLDKLEKKIKPASR